ncbi:MAG: hypothetical protein ACI92I_000744 [Acidimicrobiales bacterium]|jgi:hypothetical protein
MKKIKKFGGLLLLSLAAILGGQFISGFVDPPNAFEIGFVSAMALAGLILLLQNK